MKFSERIPGISFAVCIALAALVLSRIHHSFDPLVISIMIGMVIGNAMRKTGNLGPGIEYSVKALLPLGIALYGTQLAVSTVHLPEFLRLLAVFCSLFGLVYFLSRLFGMNTKITVLLASGLAVCGASAIAVIAPLIDARREDTSISIISLMMLGLVGMILYPILGDLLMLRSEEFAFYAGATLPMLGQVKVTAAGFGKECLELAVNLKLFRISFLIVIATAASLLFRKEGRGVRLPWFLAAFIAGAALANFTGVLAPVSPALQYASALFLSAGLAALGFSVNFESVIDEGLRPLAILLISWCVVIISFYLFGNIA